MNFTLPFWVAFVLSILAMTFGENLLLDGYRMWGTILLNVGIITLIDVSVRRHYEAGHRIEWKPTRDE